jgi:hypothetical protein
MSCHSGMAIGGMIAPTLTRLPAALSHNPCSSGRESAPSEFPDKSEPTHVGCYGSGVQSAIFRWERSHPVPIHEPPGEGTGPTHCRPGPPTRRGQFRSTNRGFWLEGQDVGRSGKEPFNLKIRIPKWSLPFTDGVSFHVAQTGSLLYRGLAIRWAGLARARPENFSLRLLALATPTTSRRYSRLPTCATPLAASLRWSSG